MGLLMKLGKIISVIFEKESEQKGNDFERYVVDLFDEKHFSIVQWTTDMTRKHSRFVESDCGPDLVLRYRSTNEIFCVECKFRSKLFKGKLQWSELMQLGRYRTFAKDNKIPFFIVIGLGGKARKPKRMFCIPLEKAKFSELPIELLKEFERNPKKNFFWKSGSLK
jgi:Holliday junction resolvase